MSPPFAEEVDANPLVQVVFVNLPLHREAVGLLAKRRDKDWSLCAAVNFVVMEERNLQEALTADRHFEQAGFVRLLRP